MNHLKQYEDKAKSIVDHILEETQDRDEALDLLHEHIDGLQDVIYYSKAWDVVTAARQWSEVYDEAHGHLTETEGDKVQDNETIDNVIVRLAYWVFYVLAMPYFEEKLEGLE